MSSVSEICFRDQDNIMKYNIYSNYDELQVVPPYF